MAKPLGPSSDPPASADRRGPVAAKKKGCKRSKCSKWKGGKCRCGRD